jgi:CYTH domain-containing protein
MTMLRQFLMAPSLARLIQRERGGERVVEGYFPDRPHHSIHVQVEEDRSSLILSSHGIEGSPEERAGIPLSQAQALLAVASGQVAYVRTDLSLGSRKLHLQQVTEPGPLCLLSVEVPQQEAEEFQPLSWFGPEVSGERAYLRRRIALDGLPPAPEVDLTEGALNSVLDLLENEFTAWPLGTQAGASEAPSARPPAAAGPLEAFPIDDADEDSDDLGIENDVIRELARSLRPQRR